MHLSNTSPITERPPQQHHQHDSCTIAVRPASKSLEQMTTEGALSRLAVFVKESGLDLHGITFSHAERQQHDYCRSKKASNAEAHMIEAIVPGGNTRLSLSFSGDVSTQTMRDVQEAADSAARRIEVCEAIVGSSLPMRKLKETVELAASCSSSTLITGESGTGKELVAQTIHNLSERASKPFVAVNCGALSEALLESELFGYVKGAFTGATANKKGLFEAAHKGTIFLDEFGEMSPAMQVKLLRVLQERKVRPVGSTGVEMPVDVRVIVATNKDLAREIDDGRFRRDLYFRVNVLEIHLPPLRDRRADIPILTRHLLDRVHKRSGLSTPAEIEPAAMLLLSEQDWAGNVRELENKLERLSIIGRRERTDATITVQHVREALGVQRLPAVHSGQTASPRGKAFSKCTDRLIKERMEAALVLTGGNQAQAATLLGMKRSAFHRLHKRVQQRTAAS